MAHNAPVVAREAPTRSDARESHQLEVDGLELGRRLVLRKPNQHSIEAQTRLEATTHSQVVVA